MTDPSHRLILTTCPDAEIAETIAKTLVSEGLAACVNILPPLRSVYTWRGKIASATEHLLLIKSTKHRYSALQERIQALHPYELPEIIAVPIVDGLPDYLSWLDHPE